MPKTRLLPWPTLLLTLGLAACGQQNAANPNADPAPPAQQALSAQNEVVPPEEIARGLAWQVIRATGDITQVHALAFRFVVEDHGTRAFEAMHHWDLLRKRDLVEWTGQDGKARQVVVDLQSHRACGTIDRVAVTGADLDTLSEQAYQRFINDRYWLVMPLKLDDPGVRLAQEAPRERDGIRYSILHMSFAHVGLTPGDQYWLFIDPASHRIDRWEMKLEGQEGPPMGTSWTDYRDVEGLTLAHDHVTDDGARHIRFEDTGSFDRRNTFRIDGCR